MGRGAEEEMEYETKMDEDRTEVRFSDSPSEVALFNSLTAKDETRDKQLVESIEKDWFTNHLSTSLAQRGGSVYPEGSQDF